MKERLKAPELRFPGFTDDWEEYKLGDLLKYEQPTKYIVKSTAYDDDFETPVLTAGQSFVLGYTNETDGIKYASSEAPVIIFDDFTTGSHYVDFPFKVKSSAMKLLRLKTDNEDFSFIYNTLKNINYVPQSHERHWISKFSEFKVSVPIIDEQVKIGTFFKNLDALITLHQRKLDLLKEQKKGYLQKMFPKTGEKVPELRFEGFTGDWEQCKLGELTTSFSGGTPSAGNSSYYKGDIPFIRSGEINSYKTKLFLTETGLKNSSAKMVSVGDILYALYGATSGEVGISQINGAINQAILAIKPCDGYDSHFIMQWLKLQKQKIIDKYLQGGQGNLSGSIVKNLVLNVPNFEEQKKIGAFFNQLDDAITLHQCKLDLLKEQKKGYLQKMFV